eukprot:7110058-Pyramimonas_sp.AAC.1
MGRGSGEPPGPRCGRRSTRRAETPRLEGRPLRSGPPWRPSARCYSPSPPPPGSTRAPGSTPPSRDSLTKQVRDVLTVGFSTRTAHRSTRFGVFVSIVTMRATTQ